MFTVEFVNNLTVNGIPHEAYFDDTNHILSFDSAISWHRREAYLRQARRRAASIQLVNLDHQVPYLHGDDSPDPESPEADHRAA